MSKLPFVIPVVLLAVGIALLNIFTEYDGWNFIGVIITAFGVACCVFILIGYPANYYNVKNDLVEFEAVRDTIARARDSGARDSGSMTEAERAAMVHKVVDWNASLAGWKYWRGTLFKHAYPREVETTGFLH